MVKGGHFAISSAVAPERKPKKSSGAQLDTETFSSAGGSGLTDTLYP